MSYFSILRFKITTKFLGQSTCFYNFTGTIVITSQLCVLNLFNLMSDFTMKSASM